MTELELYKYVTDNDIEWHRYDNEGTPDVIILPYIFQLEEFTNMVKSFSREDGLECRLKDSHCGIWMKDLCEYYGIDIDKVFTGEEK